ncbi:hypothetical protein [Rickettsia endosymbiont of Halotydeus destructor]|uniref:hypothetical protein n=1 Tax=Rickettsia endosymbiont of Halotydeus destructor TaxID=2996754 RepID=UPI003BAE4E29
MISKNIIEELQNNKLTRDWLKLGIISLGLAGLYSVILVILRTPQLSCFFPNPEIFKSALIIHVNLSVLVWLLSITASIWSYSMSFPQKRESRKLAKSHPEFISGSINEMLKQVQHDVRLDSRFCENDVAVLSLNIHPKLAFLGTMLIAISPIAGQNPVMNNYVPMLENIIFVLGLALFGVATLLFALNILYLFDWKNWTNLMRFTVLSTAIIFILTWLCFTCSYFQLQNVIEVIPIEIEFYYELLFWSGGHLLQFIYTQIAIFIWVSLLQKLVGHELKFQKFYFFLLCLNFIFSVLIVAGHFFYDIIDGEFKEYYTSHMKYFGGIAPVGCLVGMVLELFFLDSRLRGNDIETGNDTEDRSDSTIAKTTLLCSATLFLFGGLIAINISGINVVIPAHYHGSIVGISIACMGYCYLSIGVCHNVQYVIPLIAGIQEKTKQGWIPWASHGMTFAIYLLTFGQILHITGLALAGGYGVLRKDLNMEMALSVKLLMGMMGGGGLIAIVGGLMFVYICGKTIFFRNK